MPQYLIVIIILLLLSLFTGPPLEGHMSVVKSVNVPTVKAPVPNTEPKVHNPHGLKRRWKPFGFSKSLIS